MGIDYSLWERLRCVVVMMSPFALGMTERNILAHLALSLIKDWLTISIGWSNVNDARWQLYIFCPGAEIVIQKDLRNVSQKSSNLSASPGNTASFGPRM